MSDALPEMMPMTALGGQTAKVETVGTTTLTEVTNLALASVATRLGHEDLCGNKLASCLGGDTPLVEAMIYGDPFSAFWMGPGQWMVSASHDNHEYLAATLKAQLGSAASVTEQNDAWVIFDLSGDVESVMELLCAINMRAFPVGAARRTTIDHVGCFVVCLGHNHLRIFGPRSSAGSLHHALLTAMRSAG